MSFDAEAFKNAALHEIVSDKYVPLTEGEHPGFVTKAEVAAGESNGRPWASYVLTVDLEKRKNKQLRIFFNFDDAGNFDAERNQVLGQLQKACGHTPGKAWEWGTPEGHHLSFTIQHQEDRKDPSRINEVVKAVRRA
jgi:hypothetical protein